MQVFRSGYYAWLKRRKSPHQQRQEELVTEVRDIHRASKGTYGTRRIAADLRAKDIPCGRAKARTLMALAGVEVRRRKKFKVTTQSKHDLPVAPNLLNREFDVCEPDRVWVTDITYIWTAAGWLYLAVILDLFSRRVVGWSMSHRINKELVIGALRMATFRRRPGRGLILHSDRGSQYCSGAFQKELKSHGMRSSMSRKGDCWDNAVAESFFGTLKTERVFFAECKTREEARADIVDYIEMDYNSRRRHSYLDVESNGV